MDPYDQMLASAEADWDAKQWPDVTPEPEWPQEPQEE